MGDKLAAADLEGPKCPEEMLHLVRYAWQLHGRSGLGFGTMSLLSPTVIEAWATGMDIELDPLEFAALMELDAAIMFPDGKDTLESEEDEEDDQPRVHRPVVPAWGKRKPAKET